MSGTRSSASDITSLARSVIPSYKSSEAGDQEKELRSTTPARLAITHGKNEDRPTTRQACADYLRLQVEGAQNEGMEQGRRLTSDAS
jgi:ethanolamine ammonia-lyase small subunit